MMREVGLSLLKGARQALAYARGGEIKAEVHKVPISNPIKTVNDYNEALIRINFLMDMQSAKNELEALSTLVELYEDEHFPIDKPNPIEVIKFRMEQTSKNRDLDDCYH